MDPKQPTAQIKNIFSTATIEFKFRPSIFMPSFEIFLSEVEEERVFFVGLKSEASNLHESIGNNGG